MQNAETERARLFRLAARAAPSARLTQQPAVRPTVRCATTFAEPMVIGVEHELALFTSNGPVLPCSLAVLLVELIRNKLEGEPSCHFLANGAKLYVDCGDHPEYVTPECIDVLDLIAADNAGMQILAAAAVKLESLLQNQLGESIEVHLLRTNASPNGATWGTDENYSVSANLERVNLVDPICIHLASRICFTGTGTVLPPTPRDDASFRLSPRITLFNAPGALQVFSADPDLKATVATSRGRWTALQIQNEWCEAARGFASRHGLLPSEQLGLSMWTSTLEQLASDPRTLCRDLDWVAKQHLLTSLRDRHNLDWTDQRLVQCDALYHEIIPHRSLFEPLVRAGYMRTIVPPQSVEARMTEPPQNTRAKARGGLLNAIRLARLAYDVDWTECRYQAPDGIIKSLSLMDPFDADPPGLDEHLLALDQLRFTG